MNLRKDHLHMSLQHNVKRFCGLCLAGLVLSWYALPWAAWLATATMCANCVYESQGGVANVFDCYM